MMNPTALEEILGKATADTITDQDILFGRGGFTNNHAGNIEYLKLLSEHEEAYMDCKRKYQKLLSLCIIHQLRCKGVRFLKKDEKTGKWKTVKLSQCRLKISQRLRERAPFIKLEHMKASRGITKTARPITSISVPANQRESFPVTVTAPRPPVEIIAVTDASSDEEESVGFDDCSFYGGDSISLRTTFESILASCGPLDTAEKVVQPDVGYGGKRYADSLPATERRQRKRPRKVSVDEQDDYANMLLKTSLLDDFSVASCDLLEEEMDEWRLDGLDQLFASERTSSQGDMLDYLEVLF